MAETTPRLGLPLIQPAQAQKHVTVNEALLALDALVMTAVESRSVIEQPTGPLEGQAWIVPAGASGADWSTVPAGEIAYWRDGSWHVVTPASGRRVHVADEDHEVRFGSAGWHVAASRHWIAEGALGAATEAVVIEAELTGLSGATVSTAPVIPQRAVLMAVSVTVSEAIAGASSFDCGLPGDPAKFGGMLGINPGDSNLGVVSPTPFYADTPIVLTANGGGFTAGRVRLGIHAWIPRAPGA
ncbi:DUF2793 domain-containing protein [Maricaulis sp. CAU 1757]